MNTKHLITGLLIAVLIPTKLFSQFTQEKKITDNETLSSNLYMNIIVENDSSKSMMSADVTVNGLNPRKSVVFQSVTDTTFEIKNYRLYTVSCLKKGYMYYSEKFWPAESNVHVQKVKLAPLKVGLKTSVRDITFLGDQTTIYHKSKPTLDEIKEFLDINPSVKIAIVGHVNGPDNQRSKKFYHKASVERAQAVIDYLIDLGVDEERLEAQGAGNTEMLYPDPETDWQNEANRRVEILITAI